MKPIPVQFNLTQDSLSTIETEVIVVQVYEEILSPDAEEINTAVNGLISDIIDSGEFSGKVGDIFPIYKPSGIKAKYLLVVGFGNKEKSSLQSFKKAIAAAVEWAKKTSLKSITFALLSQCQNKKNSIPVLVTTVQNGLYQFNQFKSKPSDPNALESVSIYEKESDEQSAKALQYGIALAEGIKLTKDLGNTPSNHLTPTDLSDIADNLASEYRQLLSCKILNDSDMQRLGMGAIMSVAKGSAENPNLIVMQYRGAKDEDEAPIVLVGKGVTFDSGGISLKPGAGMDEMKYDMCGAASVLGTLKALAELELPINVVGIIPAVENMPSGSAVKPGDVITSMSGQTIEVLNTDAEGRLILCDALTFAEQFNPKCVIDIATLTGAIIVALGHIPTGLFSNNEELTASIKASAKTTQDHVWELPMWEDYQSQLDSNFADIANIGGGRAAGSITAACFLSRFTEKYAWAHLDIAGTAWDSGANKGATGRPVALLLDFIHQHVSE